MHHRRGLRLEHGALLDGLAHVRRLVAFTATGFAVALAAIVLPRLGGSPAHRALAVGAARGAGGAPIGATIKIRSLADAKSLLARASIRMEVGLTDSEIAATRSIYRFGAAGGSYAAGLDAYRAPLANGGYCIAFAAAVGCTRTPPNDAEPLIGLSLDPDAERSGEPFVLVAIKAPNVRSVTYTCGGPSYPAAIAGDVVTFVAPSSSLRADDCTENVILAGGKVVSKRV
jgi:hypothetical protein